MVGEMNVTSSMGMTAASVGASSLGLIVIIIAVVILLSILLLNETFLKLLLNFKKFLVKTFGYFGYGAIFTGLVGGLYFVVKAALKHATGGNPYIYKWLGILLIVYVVLSLIGIPVKYYVTTIKKKIKKVKKVGTV